MDVWKSVMRKDIEMEVLVAWTRIRFLVLVRFIYNSGRSCISPVCLNWNFNLYWTSLNTLAADFAVGSLSLPENITGMGEVVRRRPIIAGRERGEFVTAHFRRFICGNDCVERIIQQSEEIWRFILAQGFVRSSDMHRMLLFGSWEWIGSLMKETVSSVFYCNTCLYHSENRTSFVCFKALKRCDI